RNIAIRGRQPPPRVQHDDRADAGASIVYEIEACIRQEFLQSGWPILERERLQELGCCVATRAEAVIANGTERALGGMKDSGSTIEQDVLVIYPQRLLGKKMIQ